MMQIRRFLMVAILVVMTLIAYAESHVIVENEVTQVICTDVRHATVAIPSMTSRKRMSANSSPF